MGWVRYACLAATAVVAIAVSCSEGGGNNGGGGGGEGGCGYNPPEALFTLVVQAPEAEVLPQDLTIVVRWSAGEEPTFVLGDKTSWKTLDEGSNIACVLDHAAPVPTDLTELRCELWTSGTTEVEVQAAGYVPIDETLVPKLTSGCDVPVPSEVIVTLAVDLDAGVD